MKLWLEVEDDRKIHYYPCNVSLEKGTAFIANLKTKEYFDVKNCEVHINESYISIVGYVHLAEKANDRYLYQLKGFYFHPRKPK